MKFKLSNKPIQFLIGFLYLVFSSFTFVFAASSNNKTTLFCGIMLIVSATFHILLYIFKEGFKNHEHHYTLYLGLLSFVVGLVLVFTPSISFSIALLIWGIVEAFESSIEIIYLLHHVYHHKFLIVDIICSVISLIFGVLLCIHLESGVFVHLIFIGVIMAIAGFRNIFDYFFEFEN